MKKSILQIGLAFCFLIFAKNIQAQNLFATVSNGGCVGDPIFLEISGGAAPYVVDWGDGNTSVVDDAFVSYQYFFEGIFEITVTDTSGETITLVVEIFSCFFNIIGEANPCIGDCETYFVDGAPNGVFWEIYQFGNIIFSSTDFEMTYCWTEAGIYSIVASDFTGQTIEHIVNVSLGSAPIDIVSLSNAFCVSDSTGSGSTACEKICANTSAIYTVPGAQDVVWEVLGAESFTTNGNQV